MADEIIENGADGGAIDAADYVALVNDLKQNTVSKDAYNKLKEENALLARNVLSGAPAKEEAPKVNVGDLRNELFGAGRELTNLDYCSKVVELRDALLENGEPDPFLPAGHNYVPDINDIEQANKVAEGLKYCIEVADGNPEVFNREFARITVDTAPITSHKGKARR